MHVRGGTVGLYNRGSATSRALAEGLRPRGWTIFDRGSDLAGAVSAHGLTKPLSATSGHAPHLVNVVDWQRLVQGQAFAPAARLYSERAATARPSRGEQVVDGAACAPARDLHFSAACAGRAPRELPRERFLEQWYLFCRVEELASDT